MQRALDATGSLISSIREDDWIRPTRCAGWDVRALVEHLVAGNDRFTEALGGSVSPRPYDLREAHRASARELGAAFRRPGVLDDTEVLTHGWDLAHATDLPVSFPDDLAGRAIAFTGPALRQIPPERTPFAPPQPVADDAPVIDRLAALFGRPARTR